MLKILKALVRRYYFSWPVLNYYQTPFKKAVLISYITEPFRRPQRDNHNNQTEAFLIAKIFHELGYRVDIFNYADTRNINYSSYELIFGFGHPFENYFYSQGLKKSFAIYYGTGMPDGFQNAQTLKRIKEVQSKKGGGFLIGSGRVVSLSCPVQLALADAVISLGNLVTKEIYSNFFHKKIDVIPASYFGLSCFKRSMALVNKKAFLFFSGPGAIHKGLDLVLDAFALEPHLTLHICGPFDQEPEFLKLYSKELRLPNIHYHGFVKMGSDLYIKLLQECGSVLLPSCSEGQPGSVINAMAYGLLPIVSTWCGIDVHDFGVCLQELTTDAVREAILKNANKSDEEFKHCSVVCQKSTAEKHSLNSFELALKNSLLDVINSTDSSHSNLSNHPQGIA